MPTRRRRTTVPAGAAQLLGERELIVIARRETHLRVATLSGHPTNAAARSLTEMLETEGIGLHPVFQVSRRPNLASPSVPGFAEQFDLTRYFRVTAPDERLDELAERFRAHDMMEAAYVKPAAEIAARLNTMVPLAAEPPVATPDFTSHQGYLLPAPAGIDAQFAWSLPGGRGKNVRIIDIEGGWRFTHEDLRENQGGVVAGIESDQLAWRNHGTAVVGIFSADINSFGITGICPEAHVRAVSIFGGQGSAAAIRRAADLLNPGDILLIELHRAGPRFDFTPRDDQRGYIPVEWWPDDFDAIRYAVSRGILVVEAAGNGGEDLDDPIYDVPAPGFPSDWSNAFRRTARDSGAILVGAGAPPPGTHGRDHGPDRSRLAFSNYGGCLDTQAWGREVATTGYGDLQGGPDEDLWYTDQFSGTSSAAPIIVGALGCIQGILKAQNRMPLTPPQARELLRATGSEQQDAPNRPAQQRIGSRIDLRALIHVLESAGSLSLERRPGDEHVRLDHTDRRNGESPRPEGSLAERIERLERMVQRIAEFVGVEPLAEDS